MKYITLTSSNLAKYTGHNKYETLEKVVNELLTKCGIEDRYVPKTNTEESLVNLSPENITQLKLELKLPESATLDQIESVIKSQIMNGSILMMNNSKQP